MNKFNLLTITTLSLLFMSCGSSATSSKPFDIDLEGSANGFKNGEKIKVSIKNPQNKEIDKATFSIDHTDLTYVNDHIEIQTKTLGNKKLNFEISYGDQTFKDSKPIKIYHNEAPKIYTYEILNTYDHDINAYTQGLEFHQGVLYESTGLRGESTLRKVDFKTGEILKKIDLPSTEFGEGITILNDTIYQLTWQANKGYIYDLNFNNIGEFSYGASREGWGLCNDGENIYKSDGTQSLWVLDPVTLQEKSRLETVTDKSFFNKTNELEYVDGRIYANVYLKESMMIINAKNGAIEGVIDFSGLKELVTKHPRLDVLNGIAYHPTRKTFFVTGKKWDKLFEVKIKEK